ncbi:MAG: Transketolase domain protein [candidate division TM6 bacterium GW2011_GWF2_37_49]|nr:MAG: Transketolase domain protein [candidate division TM6 bacterium GW2011_GWF2_37_49]
MKNTLNKEKVQFLKHQALNLRVDSIRATTKSRSGHPTSCMSAADIVSVIFFNFLRYDTKNPSNPANDRFILSKGHAIPVVYAAWKNAGVITNEQMMSLREFNSVFEGHPTPRFAFNEAATGSLGQGLSIGLGMALNAKLDKLDYKTYVLLGDGEIAEGSVWEAAELAAYNKADNLIGFVDCNGLGQSGQTMLDQDIKKIAAKFKAFGWNSLTVNGHDVKQIFNAIQKAHKSKNKPTMIIAKTQKGYGITDIEGKQSWHGKPLSADESEKLIQKMLVRFKKDVGFKSKTKYIIPAPDKSKAQVVQAHVSIDLAKDPNKALFADDKKLSTRKAYGYALAAIGKSCKNAIALDGDVKNSTFSDMFAKDYPERFIECFIAEQNMIGVATGLQARGKIALVSTFGAFLTRAFDQIRMAGVGKHALRLCGSHCGVSIGQDGPSQMALEDIAMISTIPDSVILYPSDGVSAYKLIELSANYNKGISYVRTTRADTPMLYDINEKFAIGGCKVLRQSQKDRCCIVAAGITLHEALKAYEILKKEGFLVSVIDLYSIKPLDAQTILKTAKKSDNRVITVEDHYINGGIGSMIASSLINSDVRVQMLGLDHISRSGSPQELLSDAGIDAASIVKVIKL